MKHLFLREGPDCTTALPYNLIHDALKEYKLKLERDLATYQGPLTDHEVRDVRKLHRDINTTNRLLEKL